MDGRREDMGLKEIGILIGAFIFLLLVFRIYNVLVATRNAINYALSSIDALLKKRCDLIPNLVETVKQYMKYEMNLIRELTLLRTQAISGNLSLQERSEIDSKISRHMRNIIVSAENYPELKASSNFLQLQAALNEVEEQLSAARRALSAAITDYNNAVRMFPTNIMARILGYKEYEWYAISEESKVLPDVRRLFER
jgi:LemA protein